MYFPWIERRPGVRLEKIGRYSENHYKKDKTGNVPLPGTSLIRPVEYIVNESSDHALLLFLMISETNLAAAGITEIRNITRMYLAGSSFPT